LHLTPISRVYRCAYRRRRPTTWASWPRLWAPPSRRSWCVARAACSSDAGPAAAAAERLPACSCPPPVHPAAAALPRLPLPSQGGGQGGPARLPSQPSLLPDPLKPSNSLLFHRSFTFYSHTTCSCAFIAPQAQDHGHLPIPMLWVTLCLLGAACLPPAPRVAGFVAGGSVARACPRAAAAPAGLHRQALLSLRGLCWEPPHPPPPTSPSTPPPPTHTPRSLPPGLLQYCCTGASWQAS
jgi:hypothetical protein